MKRFFYTITNERGYTQIRAGRKCYHCALTHKPETREPQEVEREKFLVHEPNSQPYITDSEPLLAELLEQYGNEIFQEIVTPVHKDERGYYILPLFLLNRYDSARDLLIAYWDLAQ